MNNPDTGALLPVTPGRIYDKHGRQIMLGDIVKVYHFTAALRRKRHYMYKQAVRTRKFKDGSHAMIFSHLDMTDGGYHQMLDGSHLADYEIVQSVCARFDERPRAALAKARPSTGANDDRA